MKIVAMIFVGISVTFRHIRGQRAYRTMERFFREYHTTTSDNISHSRIGKIYEHMQQKMLDGRYSDMDYARVAAFEEATSLKEFKDQFRDF